MSDIDTITPYNIKKTSDEYKKNVNQGLISWSITNFSKLT